MRQARTTKGFEYMDTGFLMIFDLIALGCGLDCLLTCYKLRVAGRLFPNSLLVPNNKTPKDCLEPEAYVQYIFPRLLILGILITLFGAVTLANEFLSFMGLVASEICTGISLTVIIWYAVCSSRAVKRWW